MADKVLVAYGSKYGATKEIAEKVGAVLEKEGLGVNVVSADKVKEVTAYKAVVIGSAVYIGMWRKEVKKFIKNNEKALSERPVWIFSSGPTGEGDPVKQMSGWIIPPGLKPVIANIKPKDIAVFHGNVNVEKMSGMDKFVIKRVKSPIGDLRDWGMITEWAKKIAAEMKK